MQEKEVLEAQKRDQWTPKVGSMIFIPRMKGNFKVGHLPSFTARACTNVCLAPFKVLGQLCRELSGPCQGVRPRNQLLLVQVVSVKGDQVNVQLGALKVNVALNEIRRQ